MIHHGSPTSLCEVPPNHSSPISAFSETARQILGPVIQGCHWNVMWYFGLFLGQTTPWCCGTERFINPADLSSCPQIAVIQWSEEAFYSVLSRRANRYWKSHATLPPLITFSIVPLFLCLCCKWFLSLLVQSAPLWQMWHVPQRGETHEGQENTKPPAVWTQPLCDADSLTSVYLLSDRLSQYTLQSSKSQTFRN